MSHVAYFIVKLLAKFGQKFQYRIAENIAFERKQIWKQLAICDCGILIKVKAFSDVSFWQTYWVHKVWRLFMLM